MPISTTWVSPAAAGTLDLATGAILTETWTDGVASDLLRLGGTTGQVTQSMFTAFAAAISTASGSTVATGDQIIMTTTGTGDVLVFAFMSAQCSAAGNNCRLAIQQDSGGWNTVASTTSPIAAYDFQLVGAYRYVVPSAAAHTYATGWNVATGSGTLSQGGASRGILLVELRR